MEPISPPTPYAPDSIRVTSRLGLEQRVALEQLLFFNANQHRVRLGIEHSIATYGVPEIYASGDSLRIRVGGQGGVQSLFAVTPEGRPVGVAVFLRVARDRFCVLHLGVGPREPAGTESNTPVLLKLMHEIRGAARRTRGVDTIELVYKERGAVRPHAS